DERATRLLESGCGQIVDRGFRQDASAHVVGVGRHAEAHRREIFLVLVDEIRRELGRLADEDREHPSGIRVEGPGVADPADAQTPAGDGDDVERGRAAPLVDDQDARARRLGAHERAAPSTARRTAASTTRVASGSGPGTVHPAALTWPPPPNWAAICRTSTSPLPRKLTLTVPPSSRSRQATRTDATERG